MATNSTLQFCGFCGTKLVLEPPQIAAGQAVLRCPSACSPVGSQLATGPALLVSTLVFAEAHILLLKRRLPPYEGYWAPPGGYAEKYESAEVAAARETWEEVGVQLDTEQLVPFAISSLPRINQVYLTYLARLEKMVELHPRESEALDARWFPEQAFPMDDIWEPSLRFDMKAVFERLRAGRFEFYQRSDHFFRMISEREQFTYLQQDDPKSRKDR
jgi:ADP-ribose pyrophosphatase YjhB (NUDIX family)